MTFNEKILEGLDEILSAVKSVRQLIQDGGIPENEDWMKAAAPMHQIVNLLTNYRNYKDQEMVEGKNFFVGSDGMLIPISRGQSEDLSDKEETSKCRKFNKNEEVTVFDGRGWYQAIIEVELHTEDGEEEIPVFPIGDDGKCSLPPVYVKSSDVYPKAVGKFCPKCGRPLYVMHDIDMKYPYFCPKCDEGFEDIELP